MLICINRCASQFQCVPPSFYGRKQLFSAKSFHSDGPPSKDLDLAVSASSI